MLEPGWSTRLGLVFCLGAICCGTPSVMGQDLSWWFTPEQKAQAAKPKISTVDINQASVADLMKVPGISRVWACRIVRFRPYANKYALKLEGVLPGDVYERIKPYLVAHRGK